MAFGETSKITIMLYLDPWGHHRAVGRKRVESISLTEMCELASSLDLLRRFFLASSFSYLSFATATWFGLVWFGLVCSDDRREVTAHHTTCKHYEIPLGIGAGRGCIVFTLMSTHDHTSTSTRTADTVIPRTPNLCLSAMHEG